MRVLILGDSSSAGIGAPQAVYPSVLPELLGQWHRIENHAVPGFTSGDAARYYLRRLSRRPWDFLVVYLGNNEGAQSRYKGTYRPWRDMDRWLPRRRRPRVVERIDAKDQAVFDDGPELSSVATTPVDFGTNIQTITRTARRHGTRVILVNPIANDRYPAAMMGTNAPFYRIVGLPTIPVDDLTARREPARALVEAMRAHERGDLVVAVEGYRTLAGVPGQVSAIAQNNLAVLFDEQKIEDEPIAILERLVAGEGTAGAVAEYNLSRIHARRRRPDLAHLHATRALARDANLYRAKPAYRERVATLASEPNVDVIDLAELLQPNDFVDYCHPTVEAHRTIASAIATKLSRDGRAVGAENDAGYVCVQPNPDAYFDLRPTMVDRYAVDVDVDRRELRRAAETVLRRLGPADFRDEDVRWPACESALQANILNTFRAAADHPVITSADDLWRWLPEYGWEVGRFAEFYVYRVLHDYAAAVERSDSDDLAEVMAPWRFSTDVYRRRVLPGIPPDAGSRLWIDQQYCGRVLEKVLGRLARTEELFQDSRGRRVASVRYWYLREAFRFGTCSRYGMLYPAWELEKLAEGLCVCLVVARLNGDAGTEHHVRAQLAKLTLLRDVHERHATRFVWAGYEADPDEYVSDLAAARSLFDVTKESL